MISLAAMKNLGDKLREAREAMGVSLRDAADATRLRLDVLTNMELGAFDFDLPEIYKRGFLRMYADFLGLDSAQILAEYTNVIGNYKSEPKGSAHAFISRMQQKQAPYQMAEDRYDDSVPGEDDSKENASKSDDAIPQYVKLGGVFVGVLLIAVLIIMMLSSLLRSGNSPEENMDIALNAQMPTQAASAVVAPVSQVIAEPVEEASKELVLVLTANQDTYVLVYNENDPTHPLFSGSLEAGQKKTFNSLTPLMLKVTDAEKISIQKDGAALDLKGAKGLKRFRITPKK